MSELAKVKPDRFTDTKPEVRYKIFKRDNFTCTKCHKTGPDVNREWVSNGMFRLL